MGEDICKCYTWQGYIIIIQNIQRTLTTQNQTDKQPNYKTEDLNMFARKHTDDQQAYEKMLNITNHQGNANHNHEVLTHPYQSGYIKQIRKKQCRQGCVEREPLWILSGNVKRHSHFGKQHADFSKKFKNRTNVGSSNFTPRYLSEENLQRVWHDWVTELKWNENSNWKRYMHPCVHYRIIYNNQDTALKHYLQQQTSEPINRWIGREDVAYIWMEKGKVKVKSLSPVRLFATPWSPPGSSVHGIFQARVPEWIAISFSRGSSQPRDLTRVSRTTGRHFYRLSQQGIHIQMEYYSTIKMKFCHFS